MTFAFFFNVRLEREKEVKETLTKKCYKTLFLSNNINKYLETMLCFTVRKITTLHLELAANILSSKQRVKCKCD